LNERSTALRASVLVPDLDRLTFSDRISGESEMAFMRRAAIWQSTMNAIEAALAAVNERVADLEAVLARLTAAEMLAQTANQNAVEAQESVTVVQAAVSQTFDSIDPVYRDFFDDRLVP
jgi:hypothetical protein